MKKFTNILFTDIETCPKAQHFLFLNPIERELFEKRFKTKFEQASNTEPAISNDELWEKVYQENAALHAEFLQIVSIGFGYLVVNEKDSYELRVKTVVGKDEIALLQEFCRVVEKFTCIAGHNFNDFDGPILCRRMVINGLKIPTLLDPTDRKPWELSWKDTMKMFGYSEWGYRISLDRLCYALGVPSPKEEMDGSQVKDLFYGAVPGPEDLPFGKFDKESERFASIGKYQAGDIVATANVFLRLSNERIITEDKIKYV